MKHEMLEPFHRNYSLMNPPPRLTTAAQIYELKQSHVACWSNVVRRTPTVVKKWVPLSWMNNSKKKLPLKQWWMNCLPAAGFRPCRDGVLESSKQHNYHILAINYMVVRWAVGLTRTATSLPQSGVCHFAQWKLVIRLG